MSALRVGSADRRRRTRARLVVITEMVVIALVVTAASAHAAAPPAAPAVAGSLDTVLTNIRNVIVAALAGLATVFLTIGGTRYLMGGGDPGEIEKAKTCFKAAGIGYGLAMLAPLVVSILESIVGA